MWTLRTLIKSICLALMLGPGFVSVAQAEDWAFRRSYFTHDLTGEAFANAPMPVSRSGYRVPYIPNNPGGTVNTTWRLNRVQLRSGNSVDTQYLWQGTVDFRP